MAAQVLPSPIVFPLGAPCPNTPTLIHPPLPFPVRPPPSLDCDGWQTLDLIGKPGPHRGDVLLEIDCWMIATWTVFISQLAPFVRLCPISLFSVSVFALSWWPPALYSERRGGSFTVIGHYLHRLNYTPFSPSACLSFSGQDASLVSQWLSDLKSRTLNENPHIQRWEVCLHQEACLVDVVQFAPADDYAIMQAKIIFLHWRTFKSMYFQEIDFIRSAFVRVSFHVACW